MFAYLLRICGARARMCANVCECARIGECARMCANVPRMCANVCECVRMQPSTSANVCECVANVCECSRECSRMFPYLSRMFAKACRICGCPWSRQPSQPLDNYELALRFRVGIHTARVVSKKGWDAMEKGQNLAALRVRYLYVGSVVGADRQKLAIVEAAPRRLHTAD